MLIGVYASARNEVKNLDEWLACTEDADCVAVNDTGSTDGTYGTLGRHVAHRTQWTPDPMHLCASLNYALSQLPEDVDVAIRLDLDERLQPGWRKAVEALDWSQPQSARPWYEHNGGVTYRHDRIHSRHGFRWAYPVHEELVHDEKFRVVDCATTIEHHQDLTKDRSQVLGEIKAAMDAEPERTRWQHYYGRELMAFGRHSEAVEILQKAAKCEEAMVEERAESWRLLGDCLVAVQPIEYVSDIPFRESARMAPWRREGWVSLSILYRQQGKYAEALAATETALAINEKGWYINHPFAWDDEALSLQAELLCKAVLDVESVVSE